MEDKRNKDYGFWLDNNRILTIFRVLFFMKLIHLDRLVDAIDYWKERITNSLDEVPFWRIILHYTQKVISLS
mgnify:CR=1 FL=1